MTSITDKTREYLLVCGHDPTLISTWSSETELIKDIGIIGDDFLDEIEMLHTKFGVDLSEFVWTRHTPKEISSESALFAERKFWNWLRPGYVESRFVKYERVTLGMIGKALELGKWAY
jgi:Protein of unknown function (DUF1493)